MALYNVDVSLDCYYENIEAKDEDDAIDKAYEMFLNAEPNFSVQRIRPTMPKEIADAIKTLKKYCCERECEDCSFMTNNNYRYDCSLLTCSPNNYKID